MRKILLGIIVTGFALVLFLTVKPQVASLIVSPEAPTTEVAAELVRLEPAFYFNVVQGGSATALIVENKTSHAISFSLGHEHEYLTFRPQGDNIGPGITREILVFVDPECPVGEIVLPVYLRTEIDGKREGMETVVTFNVTPGELILQSIDGVLNVLWNDGPAPRGVHLFYRLPGDSDWTYLGETPRLDLNSHFEPGNHTLEFVAKLGQVRSKAETLGIFVEEIKAPEQNLSASTGTTSKAKTLETAAKVIVSETDLWRHEVVIVE